MEQYSPIALFTFNRPRHTQQTLDALAANVGAKESMLYIFCDGAKENSAVETLQKIEEVRAIAHKENRFKKVIVTEHSANKGLANSIIDGVTDLLNRNESIIVLEDDLITSPYFLQYMNDALHLYDSNPDVACISGYVYPVKETLPETFFIKGADCWGWATWKEKWTVFEKDGQKLLSEIKNKKLTAAFDFENSYPYTEMLHNQTLGKNDSWAVRWYASAFLKNKYCLYPGMSVVQNIGNDGSGTHSGLSDKWIVDLAARRINVLPVKVEEHTKAKQLFINHFSGLKGKNNSLLNRIARRLKRTFKGNM